MKKKLIFGIVIAVLLLLALGIVLWHHVKSTKADNSRKHEVKTTEVKKVEQRLDLKIKRYEKALFTLDTAHLSEELKQLSTEYPELLIDKNAWDDPQMLYQLKAYITDPIILEIYGDVMKTFPDMKDIESELTTAMGYYLNYFPDDSIPDFYTLVPGLNTEMPSVYAYGNDVLIHLDMYLGANYKYYSQIGMPIFVSQRCEKKYLAMDCFSKTLVYRYLSSKNVLSLLDNMIYEGKRMYFTEMMFPDKEEKEVMAYSQDKYDWAVANQGKVWSYIIEKDLLFSKQNDVIRQFIDDTPFTKPFTNNSPGRMGVFLGWKIIQNFMESNPDVELKDLMQNTDSQYILNNSGYKPKNR